MEECSFRNVSLVNPAALILLLEDTLRYGFGQIVRAKGVIPVGGELLRFDLADGLYAVTGAADFSGTPQCVFIGRKLAKAALLSRFTAAQ